MTSERPMTKKILIIDDSEQDRKIIKRFLSGVGYDNIIMSETGEDGLVQAREQDPDIILLDTNLPGMDGFETCRQIKTIKGLKAKVIIVTGLVDAVDASKARRMGADDYCVKTSDYAQLLQSVQKLLEPIN